MREKEKMLNCIEVKNLTKEYKGIKAVDDLTLEVREGEILGLLGPNGSGKTTTINCILSLLKFHTGHITIFGKEMRPDLYEVKREIGVVFQDVAVFEELTVYENIDYFCGLYITDKEKRKTCIEKALELVGLEEYKKYYPKQLSGGLLRRLNIACGVAHQPKIIFLDEPTVAVDPQSRNRILEGIQTLRKEGATIIYTTHYMEEVEILCDRIIILDKGKVLASGTTDELKNLARIEEKISVEMDTLKEKNLREIESLNNVLDCYYDDKLLVVSFLKGKNNLMAILEYLNEHKLKYEKIYSERPTLNDVFLELTGKELRD